MRTPPRVRSATFRSVLNSKRESTATVSSSCFISFYFTTHVPAPLLKNAANAFVRLPRASRLERLRHYDQLVNGRSVSQCRL